MTVTLRVARIVLTNKRGCATIATTITYLLRSYPERLRDRPYDTSATRMKVAGSKWQGSEPATCNLQLPPQVPTPAAKAGR